MQFQPRYSATALDYATLTFKADHPLYSTFAGEPHYDIIVASNVQKLSTAGANGYTGMSCDSISLLYSETGAMVRISGDKTGERFFRYYLPDCNVSRLDLQTTVWYEDAPNDVIAYAKECALDCINKGLTKTRKLSEVKGNDGGYTLYLGSRASDVFIRVYNKQVESGGEPHYDGAVRYEVELKGYVSNKVGRSLWSLYTPSAGQEKALESRIAATVSNECGKRGVEIPTEMLGEPLNTSAPRKRSDIQQKLNWLEHSVKPSVKWLEEKGALREALQALGLERLIPCLDNGAGKE